MASRTSVFDGPCPRAYETIESERTERETSASWPLWASDWPKHASGPRSLHPAKGTTENKTKNTEAAGAPNYQRATNIARNIEGEPNPPHKSLPRQPGRSIIPQKDADEKYPCPNCQKTYLHAKHLKRHLLRHTGDRPYICHLCKDTFSRSDILKRHFQKCSVRRGNQTQGVPIHAPQRFEVGNSTVMSGVTAGRQGDKACQSTGSSGKPYLSGMDRTEILDEFGR
jgi:hypothetical protein